jgi:tubulysin polyketide synthase-like protein
MENTRMAATTLLADLSRQGVSFSIVDGRLGVCAPHGVLTPTLLADLILHQAELVKLVPALNEYRNLLREAFDLQHGQRGGAAERPDAATEEDGDFLDEQARLTDDLGPVLASVVYHVTGRAWRTETGHCPWCDADGTCHEPAPRLDRA